LLWVENLASFSFSLYKTQFARIEHARFGEHGFENTVADVGRLEAALGIADLASFTPP